MDKLLLVRSPGRDESPLLHWNGLCDQVCISEPYSHHAPGNLSHLISRIHGAHVVLARKLTRVAAKTVLTHMEEPGTNVAQQRGRSRDIYRSGWGRQKRFTAHKYRDGVEAVHPRYTSQTCRNCEHRDRKNRRTRNSFKCMVCGYTEHADLNAAAIILALGIGLGGTARCDPRWWA